ncbi:hypothetical protein [Haloarcula pelagica]|uniref:hypothetical protein n=1 Tax=Haloarcula pelagica TaxID=3033389 RepID=UPI0024C31C63|nr:hypothetical protein [Halomicroarcula sp. YJ-61-S]
MSTDPPTPPDDLTEPVLDELRTADPAYLRRIAEYATDLATYREQQGVHDDQRGRDERHGNDKRGENDEQQESDEQEGRDADPSDRLDTPEGVPANATLTEKTINDNRYYYWQWRDGDRIKSKYEGPVSE